MNTVSQTYSRIENYLDEEIKSKLTPGVQFVIADKSGILFNYNKGLANMECTAEVTAQTQFKMYSTTKLLTMLGIMKLVEEGKVNLDSPIADYLPYNFPEEITVRKTLSHTAGFSHYPFIKEIHLANDNSDFVYSDFIAEMLPKHQKTKYTPGKKNRYSNYGYLVLSAIIETISGLAYEEYIHENIIAPAELTAGNYMGFQYTEQSATGYQKRGTLMHWAYSAMVDTKTFYGPKTKKWQSYRDLYMEGIGFGGGFANAQGLAQLHLAVLNHKILSKKTLNISFEPQTYKGDKVGKQTLGWWHESVMGNKAFHHAGGGGGYSCEVRVYPETGTVRIMMMNKTQTMQDLKLYSQIDELWLTQR